MTTAPPDFIAALERLAGEEGLVPGARCRFEKSPPSFGKPCALLEVRNGSVTGQLVVWPIGEWEVSVHGEDASLQHVEAGVAAHPDELADLMRDLLDRCRERAS
ncbi:MAG: hypothetical protein AAF533_09540 [Acidobacteriota bacterium]